MITAKFSSNCSKCKTKLLKGTSIYYWPSSREVFCTKCGEGPYRQFLSSAADEDVYNGCGNPYAHWLKKGSVFPFFTGKTMNKMLSARHYRFTPQKPWKHFDFSGKTISYRRSNPGFLFLLAFVCFSFTVYLESCFRHTKFRQFYHLVTIWSRFVHWIDHPAIYILRMYFILNSDSKSKVLDGKRFL